MNGGPTKDEFVVRLAESQLGSALVAPVHAALLAIVAEMLEPAVRKKEAESEEARAALPALENRADTSRGLAVAAAEV